jgi:hypothetical protein
VAAATTTTAVIALTAAEIRAAEIRAAADDAQCHRETTQCASFIP